MRSSGFQDSRSFSPQRGAGKVGHQVGGFDGELGHSTRRRSGRPARQAAAFQTSQHAKEQCCALDQGPTGRPTRQPKWTTPSLHAALPAALLASLTGGMPSRRPAHPDSARRRSGSAARSTSRCTKTASFESHPAPGKMRARTPDCAIAAIAGAGSGADRIFSISNPTRSFESVSNPAKFAAQAAKPSGSMPAVSSPYHA